MYIFHFLTEVHVFYGIKIHISIIYIFVVGFALIHYIDEEAWL